MNIFNVSCLTYLTYKSNNETYLKTYWYDLNGFRGIRYKYASTGSEFIIAIHQANNRICYMAEGTTVYYNLTRYNS